LIGRALGHYRLVEKLGTGGMGEVYVADDTRLGRRVALKLLRPDRAESEELRERFRREARAAAALNHPNIVHLYSVEEADGQAFITMELVRGRSLRAVLNDGPVPLPRLLVVAHQILEGLASAHAAGVLHRDLKPANVMVTDEDRVKILDFGLAKFFAPALLDTEADTLVREASSPGMTIGTAGYMAPEQALGRKLDVRADLFALGAVLYEMATGRAAFEGETVAAVFGQLLYRQPVPPRRLNPSLPALLAAIIDKALEKDPERRYASTRELIEDLRRVEPSAADGAAPSDVAPQRRPASIVVLPFVDLSPDKDQDYFCQGVAEELITSLARVPGLRVISRTSAFAFQGKGLDVTEIGRRLNVGTALEGSLRKAGRRVRITAQLVDAEDGAQIWSKRFDREMSDVFAIQDEIAATIVGELARELTGAALGSPATANPGAHDAYLRGLYARNKWTEESMHRAIACFREAIGHDPRFARAHAGLAEGLIWLYSSLGVLPAPDAVPEARRAVETALSVDPGLGEAHRILGQIAVSHDWDRVEAERSLLRALELAPGAAQAHFWNAWRLALLEARYDLALVELAEAERLDPLDLQVATQIGYVYLFRHDVDRATTQFRKALALEPGFAFAHYGLGDAFAQQGRYDDAIAEFEKSIAAGGRSPNHVGVLGYVHARAGRVEQAKSLLAELAELSGRRYVSPMWPALVQLGLGDADALFASLDRALEERDGSLVLVTSAVEFDPVRGDPRFRGLLDGMGLSRRPV
jgi:serine/threonine-protein kinase